MRDTLKAEDLVLGAMTDKDLFEKNYAEYRAMLPPDMPEEQARQTLEATWEIMWNFAALGWGQHPVQQAMAAQGRDANKREETKKPERKAAPMRPKTKRTKKRT